MPTIYKLKILLISMFTVLATNAKNNILMHIASNMFEVKHVFASAYNSDSIFVIKSSLVKEATFVLVTCNVEINYTYDKLSYSDISLDKFPYWNVKIGEPFLQPNGEFGCYYKMSEESPKMLGTKLQNFLTKKTVKNPVMDEQIKNINLLLKLNKENFMKYLNHLILDEELKLRTEYRIRLMRYCIIPSSYSKDYIYWKDLFIKETW